EEGEGVYGQLATRDEAIQALDHIRDPESGLSLVELGLIRDVMARESGVSLTLVLATDSEEAKSEMEAAVREALGEAGVLPEQIHIRTRPVSDFERSEIAKKLQEAGQANQAGERI